MRQLIAARFPEHGIIGEEYGRERDDAEFVWVLDPIDGTKSFISGVPLFGTLIALAQHGRPILGDHRPADLARALGRRRRAARRRITARRSAAAPAPALARGDGVRHHARHVQGRRRRRLRARRRRRQARALRRRLLRLWARRARLCRRGHRGEPQALRFRRDAADHRRRRRHRDRLAGRAARSLVGRPGADRRRQAYA